MECHKQRTELHFVLSKFKCSNAKCSYFAEEGETYSKHPNFLSGGGGRVIFVIDNFQKLRFSLFSQLE